MSLEVHITKGPQDPICPRVSCGGNERVGAIYCVYRGTLDESIHVLESALRAMMAMRRKGIEPPVDNKFKQLGAQ